MEKCLQKFLIAQNENYSYIRHVPYLCNSIADDHDFWYTCVKWWYLLEFFHFWYFHFQGVRGVKGQKKAQDDKKVLLNFISQEPYIIWSWLMAHMCKRVICPGGFLQFWFWRSIVGQKSKKWAEMTKNYVCPSTPYLSKHTSYDRVFFCYTNLKWWRL